MLTPAIFNDLDKKDQSDLVLQQPDYCNSRELPEFTVDLYKLDGFYVEVFFHKFQEDLVVFRAVHEFEPALYTNASKDNLSVTAN